MKIRNVLLTALSAVALTTVGAQAQQILADSGGFNAGYNDGDLVLSFFSSGDSAKNGNVLFDLGSASSFTGLAAGTYSVAGFNGSATSGQAPLGFGTADLTPNETVPSASTFWTVMGSNTSNNHLWLTNTATVSQQSASTQSTTAGIIQTIGFSGQSGANADGSAFDSSQTTGVYMLQTGSFQNFSGTGVGSAAVSATSDTLNLYALAPGVSGGGSATKLGYFTLTDTSGAFSLSFTATAIPEPSTYAAILGALTVGFVLVRRRFSASGFSAQA
jgi:hypothetical protein